MILLEFISETCKWKSVSYFFNSPNLLQCLKSITDLPSGILRSKCMWNEFSGVLRHQEISWSQFPLIQHSNVPRPAHDLGIMIACPKIFTSTDTWIYDLPLHFIIRIQRMFPESQHALATSQDENLGLGSTLLSLPSSLSWCQSCLLQEEWECFGNITRGLLMNFVVGPSCQRIVMWGSMD